MIMWILWELNINKAEKFMKISYVSQDVQVARSFYILQFPSKDSKRFAGCLEQIHPPPYLKRWKWKSLDVDFKLHFFSQ